MNTFVVIATTDGSPVDPEIVRRVDQTDHPDLPFVPDDYLRWSNARHNVHVSAWQAFTDLNGVGSHWHTNSHGLTMFTGHPAPRGGGWSRTGGTWAAQLADDLAMHGVLTAEERLLGLFSILSLPFEEPGYAVSDLISMGLLYNGRVGNHLIIASRAALVARALTPDGIEPARDLLGSGWIPYSQVPISLDTGFANVQALPFTSHVEFDPGRGARIVPRERPFWEIPGEPSFPLDEQGIGGYLENELRATIRTLSEFPASERQMRLSGGRDSRLIAALILLEEVQDAFTFFSFGLERTPDVIVARSIAERFDLNWKFESREAPEEREFEQPQRINAFQVSGARTGWDAKGQLRASTGMTLSGNMSELFRFGPSSASTLTATTFEESRDAILLSRNSDFARMLKPEVREHYNQAFAEWIRQRYADGVELTRLGSLFMPEIVGRRLYGAGSEVMTRTWIYPLYSPAGARAAQNLPLDRRYTQRLHFDIINHAHPDLAKLPFVNHGWRETAYSHLPNAADYADIPFVSPAGPEPTHWRVAQFDAHRPIFRRYLDDPSNPVFDLVDYNRVMNLVASPEITTGRLRTLYSIFSTALWLGHHELPARMNRTGELDFYQSEPGKPRDVPAFSSTQPAPPSDPESVHKIVSSSRPVQFSAPPKSIALVVSNFPVPSQTFIVDKYLHLLSRGWDINIIALNRDKERWDLYPEIESEPLLRDRVFTGRSIAERLHELKPDLVNFEFGDLALGSLETVKAIKARSIVGFRGYDICYQGLSVPGYYREIWDQADAVMLRSDDLWSRAIERGCPPDKLHTVIVGAVDSQLFDPGERAHRDVTGTAERPFRIVSVGRLVWKKGYEIGLQALRELLDSGVHAHLTIIGDGNMRSNVEYTIFDLGLADHVTLLGAQSRDRVFDEMMAADAFMMTSLSEGFGISALEAQSMRLPVVASDAEGLPENVADGVTGFVVPKRDPLTTADRLRDLAMDPALRQAMGSAGRHRVETEFTTEREIDAFEALFTEVIDRPLRARRLFDQLKRVSGPPTSGDLRSYLELEQAFADWVALEDSRIGV